MFAGMAAAIALVICAVFTMHAMRTYELWKYNGWKNQVYPPLSVAVFALGSTIFNGTLWLGRHLYNQDFEMSETTPLFTIVIALGLGIKIAAGLAMVQQFTFKGFGRFAWVYALGLCIAVAVYSYVSYTIKWGLE